MPKSCVIQYRRLKRDDFPLKDPFKKLMVQTLEREKGGKLVGEHVGHRRFDLDQDGRIALLNKITERKHWETPFFSGQLIYFEKGANVPAIIGDLDAEVNELDLMACPTEVVQVDVSLAAAAAPAGKRG